MVGASVLPLQGSTMLKKQLPTRQEQRDQRQLEDDRYLFGSQGAASACRKIDPASVDEAVLVARLEQVSHKPR